MSRLRTAWDGFWLAPEPETNLRVARAVLCLHAIWILLSRDLPAMSALPPAFYARVPSTTRWRYLLFEGHSGIEAGLVVLAVGLLLAAAAGVRAQWCGFLSALLLYHLSPLETLFFTPSPWVKGLTPTVPALIALSLATEVPGRSIGRLAAGTVPGWPLKLAQLFVCEIYLFSGYAKLRRAGLDWASPSNIQDWLMLALSQEDRRVFDQLGPWLLERPLLCGLAGAFALAVDLGFVLVLFSKRARWIVVPAAVVFHTGIMLTLNYFYLNLPHLLLFADWSLVARRLSRRPG